MTTSTESIKSRFEAAVEEAKDCGVQFVLNYEGEFTCDCCNDVSEEVEDLDGPVAWNSVNNRNGFEWDDENTCLAFERVIPEEPQVDEDDEDSEYADYYFDSSPYNEYYGVTNSLSFNHSNGAAEIIAQVFSEFGFVVKAEPGMKVEIFLS